MDHSFVSNVIAGCAFGVSLFSLALHTVGFVKSGYRLKIDFNDEKSFYFDGIASMHGSQESLVANVVISNNSDQPIYLTDMQIIFNKHTSVSAVRYSEIPYPSHLPDETYSTHNENGMLFLKAYSADGMELIDLPKELITLPIYLKPYESISGYILFPIAGVSVNKTKFKLITSRKKEIISHSFTSKQSYENARND